MALTGTGVWPKVRTAVFFPVALGIGLAAGVAVGNRTDLMLGVFVLVMFLAMIVRRFGPAFFFYGFMTWMGYFFAAFLHATPAMLPSLLLTATVASAWILALSITVLRTNPRRTLARIVRAFDARSRDVARRSAALLEAAVTDPERVPRLRRGLAAHQRRLAEAALMIEGWSAEAGALPAGRSATALRRQLLDAQLAVDGLATAAGELVDSGDTAPIAESARIAGLLARGDYAAADRAAAPAVGGGDARTAGRLPARHLAAAVAEFVALARRAGNPSEADAADDFAPAVTLAMGNLPGSAAFAGRVAARGHRWNPLARLDFISRQAVQAGVAGGLAILVGREISTTRYYWAVIAAFVAFSGTATRSETSIKAFNRVLGTVAGLFVGLGLARLTTGHTIWVLAVVVASVSGGLYLMRISYRYMIFFITIMVAQLYSVLHELSGGLLVMRLEETAAGAAVGIVVALVLAPLSTRDVATTVRRDLLTALGDLLAAAAGRLGGDGPGGERTEGPAADLDGLVRGVDLRLYQLMLAAAPLTRPFVWGNDPYRTRHRLTLYASCAHYARVLAAAARRPAPSPALADACRALADATSAMADEDGPAEARRAVALDRLAAADAALFDRPDPADPAAVPPAVRALIHLQRLLRELAVSARPGEPAPEPDTPTAPVPTSSVPTALVPTASAPTAPMPAASVPAASVPNESVPIVSAPTGPVPAASVPNESVPTSYGPAAPAPNELIASEAVGSLPERVDPRPSRVWLASRRRAGLAPDQGRAPV
jgi:uncharacterized membrane protein YccC